MKFIWIKTNYIGFHRWKEAPEECKYLRDLHRHTFNVKVWLEVKHNERDVEFYTFKKQINTLLTHPFMHQHSSSCEMYCDALHHLIQEELKIKDREIRISIDEDGEAGAYKE